MSKTTKMKYKAKLILLLLISPVLLFAQQDLSLGDAIKKGLENNYQILISEHNKLIANNNNSWGNAGRYPSINIGTGQGNRFDNRQSMNASGRDEYLTNSLAPYINLNWVLFNGCKVKIAKSNLALLSDMSEGNMAIVVENTLQGIILAYYKSLLASEQLNILKKIMALSNDRYKYLMMKKEIGSVVTYDVLQAENAYLTDSANVIQQQINCKNAMMNLNLLMGDSIQNDYNLTDEFVPPLKKYSFDDLYTKLSENNKTVKNQYLNQHILNNSIKFQKSLVYPVLSVNSGYDYNTSRVKYKGMDANTSYAYDYYLNFSLSFNIFNGGNSKRAIKNAIIESKIVEIKTTEMLSGLKLQLVNTFEMYSLRNQLFKIMEENMKTADLNLKISTDKFKSGTITSFEYRDVQNLYINSSLKRSEAIYNLIDSNTELMRLTGGIVEEL